MSNRTNQFGARADGDIVGRDKTEVTVNVPPMGRVEKLLHKLKQQVADNVEVQETIDSLARFYSQHPDDDIVGLEAKLTKGGREAEFIEAIRQKERFSMLLERYSMYSTAQQIFAHFLAKVEVEFRTTVLPEVDTVSHSEINKIVNARIVAPIVEECGDDEMFQMDYDLVYGMIYWLAEQCYVRWHK